MKNKPHKIFDTDDNCSEYNDGSFNRKITWEDLGDWRNNFKECPDCGIRPRELLWFEFRSSDKSWRHLAGRQGLYSKCPNCEKVVEEIVTALS